MNEPKTNKHLFKEIPSTYSDMNETLTETQSRGSNSSEQQ